MSYTFTTAVGDGITTTFPFSFAGQDEGYLRASDITGYVAGIPAPFTINNTDPNKIIFTNAPAVGAEVLIRRIMPKNVPYADFARGNPFSQDTLNNTNLQMLYLIQEIYDGYLPDGFYFRVDIDMHGKRIINLGEGVDEGDAINKGQFDVEVQRNDIQDMRLTGLEDAITSSTIVNYIAQVFISIGGETQISTINSLFCVGLYTNGIFQFKLRGAYTQTGGTITLAEPLLPGDEVYLILGSSLPSDMLYPTIDDFTQLQDVVTQLNTQLGQVDSRLSTVETSYAKRGTNNDITSLSGLSTPLSALQGGTGNNVGRAATATKLDVPRGLRVNLASTSAQNFDGSSDVQPGVSGNLPITNGGHGANTLSGAQTSLDIFPSTGVITATDAAAGKVGEYLSATGTATTVAAAQSTTLASLNLTPGDWEVVGMVNFAPSGGTNNWSQMHTSIQVGATPAVFPYLNQIRALIAANGGQQLATPMRRVNVSANTTVYVEGGATFPDGTMQLTGFIRARRVR